MFPAFSLARLPRIIFGHGVRAQLPHLISAYGKRALVVTGARHFQSSPHWTEIQAGLKAAGIAWEMLSVDGEPSPAFVDKAVRSYRNSGFGSVVGLGGGSALDAAKAIAGLLKPGNSVMDHLEGVGPELPYRGPATPFIAVPTTAGTGSEATKNAVLSIHGPDGFKKSFRDEKLVAEIALVDPDLLSTCPPHIIAANGMDAFTQLLESYVSSKANRFTDALAWSGMKAVRNGLLDWYKNGPEAHDAQAGMAYAALLSGITLAQVGLGSVHGLASPLGAFFPIPHGVVCGTLVAEATAVNIRALQARAENRESLLKYAQAGRMLAHDVHLSDEEALERLVEILYDWTAQMQLPRLSALGVTPADIPRIVSNSRGSSMKTNPVTLTDAEIGEILAKRI
ncbi:MAG: iron-containing alcohol dehydrogenase [Pseudomonadota bacterium]